MMRKEFPKELDRYLVFRPNSKTELIECAVAIFLEAPDRYHTVSNAPPELTSTHESEFFLMHEGVEYVLGAPTFSALRDELHDLLHRAYDEFLEGDEVYARSLMDQFMAKVSDAK